jgi:hypothetical protein
MDSDRPSPLEAEVRFRDLLERGGLAQPDSVIHDREANELVLRWRERKVVIVIELTEEGRVGARPPSRRLLSDAR